jgi:hypothetical protein
MSFFSIKVDCYTLVQGPSIGAFIELACEKMYAGAVLQFCKKNKTCS